ncbi:MAG: pepsin/retropepsin-like aspartic protease family protein [Gemmatimonadota bacterium]|nr:pepsin/retropepsin-like aspartic protease family protein [Gemmatimonadota bacterium]
MKSSAALPAPRGLIGAAVVWIAVACTSVPRATVSIDPAERWIPLDLSPVCVPIVEGAIDGRPAALVLDTGVSVTLVDSTWAATVGMETAGGYAVNAPGGTRGVRRGEAVDLAFGGVALSGVRPLVLDLSWFAWYFGVESVAIVGSELFRSAVVDLDYRNARVAVRDPASPSRVPAGATTTLPLEPAATLRLREVTGRIGGRAFGLELDTGSNGNLTVARRDAALAGVEPGPDAREAVTVGVAGEVRETVTRIDSLVLAGLAVRDVPTRLSDEDGAGTLGCGVLRRFRAVFDYPEERLHLVAGSGWRDVPFVENRSGIVPGPHPRGIEVVRVIGGGAAEEAGLRAGDVIVVVDGVAVEALPGSPVAWIYGPAGTRVELELSGGARRTLELR